MKIFTNFFIPITVETLWPFPSQIPWLVFSLDLSFFLHLATCRTFRMCQSVKLQWTVGYFSVDYFTLLFFIMFAWCVSWLFSMQVQVWCSWFTHKPLWRCPLLLCGPFSSFSCYSASDSTVRYNDNTHPSFEPTHT